MDGHVRVGNRLREMFFNALRAIVVTGMRFPLTVARHIDSVEYRAARMNIVTVGSVTRGIATNINDGLAALLAAFDNVPFSNLTL